MRPARSRAGRSPSPPRATAPLRARHGAPRERREGRRTGSWPPRGKYISGVTEGLALGRRLGASVPTRLAANPVLLFLAGAVLASGALLLAWGSRLTFLLDDWEFLIYRRGWSAHVLLDP